MTSPISVLLTDFWGNTWDLTPPAQPYPRQVGLRLKEISGLAGAPFSFTEVAGVTTDGVLVTGRKDDPNTIKIKLWVDYPGGGPDAVAYLMGWRRALGRGLARDVNTPPLQLTVGETGRWQDVRLLSADAEPDLQSIASPGGMALEELTLRSDLTWWRADPIVRTFTGQTAIGSATVPNRGDIDVWPQLKLTGPITTPKIGIAGELISLPNLAAGQWLDIDADPDYWSALDQAGNDRSWDIGIRWQKQVPANTENAVVSVTGTGITAATSLTVTVPQYFWAAI
ncbi:hypothetical protein [Gordonia jinhuaensis]|uniref:hypothetical protein n=1 Tax=Gordonia jinhuaensis TaxID=1517702 RepID=UPI0016674AD7|nr:hypothetical protein [Gordonia jinhuaensis]